ncbi:MAG: cation:proton antiporter [Acidimicrobiales bacterium]
MDTSSILIDLLVVLVAAKAAAEVSERIGVPAVVGEILAGLLVGPSILGWVGHEDEVLHVLGEIGVILLLLDVGLEMDLGELRKVGGASLGVATMGVVAPMVTGYVAMLAMGESSNTALFVGAALTATSVGITARVFGDLRALATTEADRARRGGRRRCDGSRGAHRRRPPRDRGRRVDALARRDHRRGPAVPRRRSRRRLALHPAALQVDLQGRTRRRHPRRAGVRVHPRVRRGRRAGEARGHHRRLRRRHALGKTESPSASGRTCRRSGTSSSRSSSSRSGSTPRSPRSASSGC